LREPIGFEKACFTPRRKVAKHRKAHYDIGCSMITFQIAGYLTEFTAGAAEIKIDASPATVRQALNDLWERHLGLKDRVLTEQGEVRQHVNIFVNSSIVRRDQVLDAPLEDTAEICIMPAVSGGSLRLTAEQSQRISEN
jgi:molybdopterin converting factor small subunit